MNVDDVDAQQRQAAEALFSALATLAKAVPDANVLPCVRALLPNGAQFEIYKADRMPAAVPVWKVRGFYQTSPVAAATERRGLILRTQDGRAVVTGSGGIVQAQSLAGDVVQAAESCERKVSELADVIAAAIRGFVRD